MSTDALSVIAETFPTPVMGSVAVRQGPADLGEAMLLPAHPVAALVGPRAVRATEIDVDALSSDFQVRRVGRSRLPSVVATFAGAQRAPGDEIVDFVQRVGAEAWSRAFARPGQGRNEGAPGAN